MSVFTPLRGSFMYAPMYVKCIEHLYIRDNENRITDPKKKFPDPPPKHQLWQAKKVKLPTATMTRNMISENEASEDSSTGATTAMATANIEGSSVARRPTSLLTQTLNTPVLTNAPSFPLITDDATPTFVITPTTLSSILDLIFTPTSSAVPSPLIESYPVHTSRGPSPSPSYITPPPSAAAYTETSSSASSTSHLASAPPPPSQLSQQHLQHVDLSHNAIAYTNSVQVPETVAKRLASSLDMDEEDMGLDSSLAEAAVSALTTGSLTPLVKEELKYAIQNKRLKTGKEELQVEYKETKPEKLSQAEEERRRQRRERNRLAAQKCRNKRRSKMSSLEEESKELQSANSSLKKQIRVLEAERQKLSLVMRCHDISSDTQCPSRAKLSTSESPASASATSDGGLFGQRASLASSMSSEQAYSVFDETDTDDSDTMDAFPMDVEEK